MAASAPRTLKYLSGVIVGGEVQYDPPGTPLDQGVLAQAVAASHSFAPPVVPWPELLQEAAERVARAERDLNDLRACAERVGAQVGS